MFNKRPIPLVLKKHLNFKGEKYVCRVLETRRGVFD